MWIPLNGISKIDESASHSLKWSRLFMPEYCSVHLDSCGQVQCFKAEDSIRTYRSRWIPDRDWTAFDGYYKMTQSWSNLSLFLSHRCSLIVPDRVLPSPSRWYSFTTVLSESMYWWERRNTTVGNWNGLSKLLAMIRYGYLGSVSVSLSFISDLSVSPIVPVTWKRVLE